MPAVRNPSPDFELKSTALTLVSLILRTTDLAALAQALNERFGDTPELFDQEPVAIDVSAVRDAADPIDFEALVQLLRERRMLPIAAKGGSEAQMLAALAAGLVRAPEGASRPEPASVEVRAADGPADEPPPASAVARTTLVVERPLRSGQRVYARGGDLVVLALVSHGAEVIADGSIHVYAPLRGRALAGARGDVSARIYCTCMEPQLLSIAGIYRTTETELPEAVLGKAAQVWLDGEKLIVAALNN